MTKNVIKKVSILILSCILLPVCAFASDKKDSMYIYQGHFGVSLGADIGGAMPFPVSNIPGTINAYPQINQTLGVASSFSLIKGWGLGLDVIYKTAAMRADASVSNQRFNMDDATMYFSGTIRTDMKFIMLEFPLYAKYRFKNKDFAFAGLYYSRIFSSTFIADPVKGYSGSGPDIAETTDVSDIKMDFSPDLAKWDWGTTFGYERAIFDRLKLAIRFSFGFKDIFKHSSNYFDYSMLHIRGGAVLTYDLWKTKSLFGR